MSQKISINADLLKVFETVPDLYLILSPDLHILTASNAYLEATFTLREQIVGRYIFDAFPDNPDTFQAKGVSNVYASLKEVLANGKPHQMALQRYDVPKPETKGEFEKKYWQPIHTPVLDDQKNVLYIIQKVIDVTRQVEDNARIETLEKQQQQNREQLDHQHNLLKMLLDQAPVGISLFQGEDLEITSANAMICEMWGYSAEQVLEKPLFEAIPELRGQGFDALIQNVLRSGIPYHGRQQPAQLLTNGKLETKYFNFTYMAFKDKRDAIIGVLTVAAEVTEQVLVRQQLEQSFKKEQSLNEELAALNEELRVTNEELAEATRALEKLNNELDERVQLRTKELKLAQQETERQRKVLHDLFMEAPAPIIILDGEEMVYQLVNPAYRKLFPGRDMLGKTLPEAYPELAETPIPAILHKVYRTGETYYGNEMPLMMARNACGPLEQIYWTFTYQARRNKEGAVDGIVVYASDVTEQVEARKKIEESQEELKRFMFMADKARDAFVLMREDGSFAYLNKKALEAWEYTVEEIQHLRVPDVDPIYQQEAFLQLFARAQKEAIPQFETLHKTKKGRIFPVEVNVVGLTLGETPYLFAIARDITKRKQAEKEMKINNTELTRINNDLDNFIYTASHDLKAPISNIEALLHALLRTLSPESLASERSHRITSMMQESVERFKKTIANLTEIVKLQKENSSESVMINLAEVIEEVRLDLEQLIQSSGAQIELDVSDCPYIHFSEKNLRSVVYNLLSNAIKYRAPERVPRVQITCKSTTDYHVLSVKDNGLGIDPKRTDQLFTMFKRLHSHVEGTGIGLYMVKKMVENASGRIEVESQLGEGTTFHVYFKR